MSNCKEAEALIKEYFKGPCYYDHESTGEPNAIGVLDVCLTATVNSRIGYKAIDSIMQRKEEIDRALCKVKEDWTLENDFSNAKQTLNELFSKMIGPDIGVSRATKILHKKRPSLIPMLDKLVINHLCRAHKLDNSKRAAPLVLIEVFQKELLSNIECLKNIEIPSMTVPVSTLRKYEVLIWLRHSRRPVTCSCQPKN